MYFTINLATRTYLDRRLVNRLGAGICVVLLLMLAWNVNRAAWNLGELRRLRTDISSYENRLRSRPNGVSEKEYANLLGNISFYNEIIGRKTYNWMGLLEHLENTLPDGIALSLISPDMKSGEIKIEGRAKNFAQIRSYLDKLEDSKAFTSILLLSNSTIAVGERTKGVQFSISCKAAPQ
ncbi:MAG: PilN domain-containing protein [Geobacteraceae bacterium]|nr:PilN domain-containing protein [Geobacteraceae bacterium]